MMKHNAIAIESRPGNFTVLSRFLEKLNINEIHIQKLEDISGVLSSGFIFSVAIIDTMGFDDSVFEHCRQLRKRGIPMLIISPGSNMHGTQKHWHGATVFKKPVAMKELAACIRSLINQE